MMRILAYSGVALVTFFAFIIVFAPAATLWNFIKDDVLGRVEDLRVLTVDGTVWNGNAMLRYREFQPTQLSWTLSPLPLLQQSVVVEALASGEGLALSIDATATPAGLVANASGTIDNSYINPVSTRYGLTFPGRLVLRDVRVESDLRWLTSAQGTLDWDGGQVLLQLADPIVVNLPPLVGNLSLADGVLLLNVTQAGNTVIQVNLRPSGWAIVDIRARLLDLAGLPRNAGLGPDNSAALLEEKIF